MKIDECTIVAGKRGDDLFLFKNSDNPKLYNHEIIRDIVNGVEVAYYTNSNGWSESMSEMGVGMVYAYFTGNDTANDGFSLHGKTKPDHEEIDPYYLSEKGAFLLSVVSSKNIEEGLSKIKNGKWDGNYFLSDGKKHITYDIEKFEESFEYKIIEFKKDNDYRVKSNHGQMLPLAGHLNNGKNMRRADSEIRKGSAERYLYGFKDFNDVIHRMSTQEFSPSSSLNLFRTDAQERTTAQVLMNLTQLEYNFIFYDETSEYLGIYSKLPKEYEPKIKINVIDRKDLYSSEYDEFQKKREDLYNGKGQDFKPER